MGKALMKQKEVHINKQKCLPLPSILFRSDCKLCYTKYDWIKYLLLDFWLVTNTSHSSCGLRLLREVEYCAFTTVLCRFIKLLCTAKIEQVERKRRRTECVPSSTAERHKNDTMPTSRGREVTNTDKTQLSKQMKHAENMKGQQKQQKCKVFS